VNAQETMERHWREDQRRDSEIAQILPMLDKLAEDYSGRKSASVIRACIEALREEREMAVRRWD
jgi:hypothetical protein